jgi:hypothetical protein
LAQVRCECCQQDGFDQVAQFCLEEALMAALSAEENRELDPAGGESETKQRHREIMERFKAKASVG